MRAVFMLDRVGAGMSTSYAHRLQIEDPEWLPGIDDFIRIQAPGEETRIQRQVWKRTFSIDGNGEIMVKIFADDVMGLIRRRRDERIEERSKMDLWRAPSEAMDR
jgi:hypothetical protein